MCRHDRHVPSFQDPPERRQRTPRLERSGEPPRGGRVVQRHVLSLGEINDAQRAAWCRSMSVFDEDAGAATPLALFPEDRQAPELAGAVVPVKLSEWQRRRPRPWGACWLAGGLWDRLELDTFWPPRRPPSRQGTRWLNVLKTLVAYRLIDPGSEWRLHRHWFDHRPDRHPGRCSVGR